MTTPATAMIDLDNQGIISPLYDGLLDLTHRFGNLVCRLHFILLSTPPPLVIHRTYNYH